MWKSTLVFLLLFSASSFCFANASESAQGHKVLLLVLDGLRPDYVTHETMPNLYQLGENGVFSERHHSAFPTLTRVNSAVLATGAYPEQNGLLGNHIFFPNVNPTGSISTWSADSLIKVDKAEYGKLLTATSLCEMLAADGKTMLVCSSGSSGSAFLQNHKLNGSVINVNTSYPASIREKTISVLGVVPKESSPNTAQARWAVDAYLKIGLEKMRPDYSVLWLNEPDHTAHKYGIGAPETVLALQEVDREIGRILKQHTDRGLDVNILVVSDHGFITQVGGSQKLESLLEQAGLKTTDTDIVEVDGAIYINENKTEKLPKVVKLLRAQSWVGAIYTRPSDQDPSRGIVPGTLSTNIIRWNHRRAADVFVESDWNHEENKFGIKGTNYLSGEAAGHGGSSPYEIHATFLAAGPAFKKGLRNKLPTGNVDIAPTIAHLLGYKPLETMQGRVLQEVLQGGSVTNVNVVKNKTIVVASESVVLKASLEVLGRCTYLNYVETERK